MITNKLIHTLLITFTLLLLAASALAGGLKSDAAQLSGEANAADFLDVNEAFILNLNIDSDAATLVWVIAPEYYLYQHAFSVSIDFPLAGGKHKTVPLTAETVFSHGIKTTDPYFGPVEVYYYQATATLPIMRIHTLTQQLPSDIKPQLTVQYQGCAEAGLCYPVQSRQIKLP